MLASSGACLPCEFDAHACRGDAVFFRFLQCEAAIIAPYMYSVLACLGVEMLVAVLQVPVAPIHPLLCTSIRRRKTCHSSGEFVCSGAEEQDRAGCLSILMQRGLLCAFDAPGHHCRRELAVVYIDTVLRSTAVYTPERLCDCVFALGTSTCDSFAAAT